MTLGQATVSYCINKYGPRLSLAEACEILEVGASTFYAGIREGKYPEQEHRGRWSTEKVALAAAGANQPALEGAGDAEDDGL